MKTVNGVQFRQVFLDRAKYNIKAPYSMVPKKITLHNTDNEASAINEINFMNRNNLQVSYHVAVDEKEVVQGLPFDRNGWHCGDGANGFGNRNTIGIEICRNYDRTRRTTNLNDPLKSQYEQAELNAIKYTAQLCLDIGIEANNENIRIHRDWNGKNCPSKILNEGRLEQVKAAVILEYNRLKGTNAETIVEQGELYRVQTGAFRELNNAISLEKRLELKKVETYIVKADGLYKVQTGAFREKSNADNRLKQLHDLNFEAFITQEEGSPVSKQQVQKPKVQPQPKPQPKYEQLKVDGAWGRKTTRRLQEVLNAPVVDGIISGQIRNSITQNIHSVEFGRGGSLTVRELQRILNVKVDGYIGPITTRALQRRLGTPITGSISRTGSAVVREMQRRLNNNRI